MKKFLIGAMILFAVGAAYVTFCTDYVSQPEVIDVQAGPAK
jgi:hypothetical protein